MSKLMIKGGTLVTMNAGRQILSADILIENDRIKEISPRIESHADQIINAAGLVVIPGLIQPHTHLTQSLFRGLADDLELLDWLKKRIWPLEAAHLYESNLISARLGIAELIMGGTTSIIDMGTVNHTRAIFETVRDTGFRAVVGKCMMDHGEGVPKGLMESSEDSINESEALMKEWHESANGRIRYAFAPRFVVSCSEALLLKVKEISQSTHTMVHTHASENQGEIALVQKERGMRNIKYLEKLGLTGENLILAHCIWLDDEEMNILASTGTKITHCPSSNMKLASGIAKIPELIEMGVHVSIAADGAPCNNNLSMFREMRHAALIQKVRLLSPTAMPAGTIFEMATLGGARAMGMENELGSLEIGKKADMALVDLEKAHASPGIGRDPVSRLVYSATAGDVHTTIVNGKILMQDRKLETIDISDTINQANTWCEKIMKNAGVPSYFV
jgi:5-methylthioadenosine/S-adenosylhomocysteine deaminase